MSGSIPISDPTLATTDHLRHELSALRDIIETRLDAMDRSTVLFQENLQRVPTSVDKQVGNLKSLHDEKFDAIEKQFIERDVRSEKVEIAQKEFAAAQAVAAGVANTVALSAQKEQAAAQSTFFAATMTERQLATTKQIDAIITLLGSTTKASDDKIAALTARLDRGEGGHAANTSSQSTLIAAAAVIVAAIAAGFAIYHSSSPPPAPQIIYGVPQQQPQPPQQLLYQAPAAGSNAAPAVIQVPSPR